MLASTCQPARRQLRRWAIASREHTNYSYDLTDLNIRHLACFVAQVTKCPVDDIASYINELQTDGDLRAHHTRTTEASGFRHLADEEARFGRRVGWYAIVRATKPRVVVETGVDKGLGACVLTAALLRNAAEGDAGWYYGTDLNPKSGYLLTGRYASSGEVLIGDSIESLRALGKGIDLFINDSDHSAPYERREYEVIEQHLDERSILIGDNAHANDELLSFAARSNRSFLFFAEHPKDHWYLGGGIGVAFPSQDKTQPSDSGPVESKVSD